MGPPTSTDRDRVRRCAVLARRVLHLLGEQATPAARDAAYELTDELATWDRRLSPRDYGREPGDRP